MANLFLNTLLMRIIIRATVMIVLITSFTLGSKSVLAAGPTTKIVIEPANATIASDQTQIFKILAVDIDGTSTEVTDQSTLSTNDPFGSVSGVTYNGGQAGTWSIQAVYQSFVTTAAVNVTAGPVKEIVVNPNSDPELLYLGTNMKFSASAYDAKNNVVENQIFTWSVIGEQGSINSGGTFVPKKIGTGKVQASIGTIQGSVSVVVVAAATNINRNLAPANNKNTKGNINAVITNSTTNTPITSSTQDFSDCTTLKPWVWTLILVMFLLGVSILFALFPVTQIWPAVIALGLAAGLAIIQRNYACQGQAWWAWIITLGTIALSTVALQMRPKNPPTV